MTRRLEWAADLKTSMDTLSRYAKMGLGTGKVNLAGSEFFGFNQYHSEERSNIPAANAYFQSVRLRHHRKAALISAKGGDLQDGNMCFL